MKWQYCIFLSSILCTASGSHVSLAELPKPTGLEIEPHLTALLFNGQIHQPEVYAKAISILETMESVPSCHRVATLTLINSCQGLEKSPSSEVELYEVREEYSTRLAMCEITGAKTPISPHCADFVPGVCSTSGSSGFFRRQKKSQDNTKAKICYPDVTRKQVEKCITALSSSPQWWTSYSNAAQNVRVICQASRNAIEQEEILEQFKNAAIVGNGVTQTVAEALKQSKDFEVSLRNLRAQVLRDWETETEKSRSALGHLILDVQTAVYSMIESFRQGAEGASSHMDRLKQDMEKGHEITTNTSLTLQSLYESAQTHFDDMTATQRGSWERVGIRADEIGNTLATVNADLPDILNVLQTILDHFQQSSQNLSNLHAELEAKIEKNNNNLILQEHLIKRLGMTGGFDFVQSIILAAAGIVIIRSINSWAAISMFTTLIMWLVYQAFSVIPFVHMAPIQTTLPVHPGFAPGTPVEIVFVVAFVIGLCVAMAWAVKQRNRAMESRYHKTILPRAMTDRTVLLPPQPVAQPIPVCDHKIQRPYQSQPFPGRTRDCRAGSAPP